MEVDNSGAEVSKRADPRYLKYGFKLSRHALDTSLAKHLKTIDGVQVKEKSISHDDILSSPDTSTMKHPSEEIIFVADTK